jgi:hypothetical protein
VGADLRPDSSRPASIHVSTLVSTEGYALSLDAVSMMVTLSTLAAVHFGVVLKDPGSQFHHRRRQRMRRRQGRRRSKI